MRVAHTLPPIWPPVRPGRFAAQVCTEPEGCQLALLGLPDDTGVRLNGGRPGANAGPASLRSALAGFGTSYDTLRRQALTTKVFDAGDVEPAAGDDEAALLETHRRVEAAARELHGMGMVVMAIGGGHDLALPTVSALSRHVGRAVGGVNVDAHLDVRERVGSGMPFRRLIAGGFLDARSFVEAGLGRFANDQNDLEWLEARGAQLVLAEQVLRDGADNDAWLARALLPGSGFLSVDLDGLDVSAAPGVSAQSPMGLRIEHVAGLCEAAGARPEIRHFELMELCPPRDVEERTARGAAYLLLCFVAGFQRRPA